MELTETKEMKRQPLKEEKIMLEILVKEVFEQKVSVEKAQKILTFYTYTTDMNVKDYQEKIEVYKGLNGK